MTTQLTVVERASVALGSSALEIHLNDLVKKHADITAIANKDGREQVHAAAMALRKQRTTIAAAGKGARDDATKFCKADGSFHDGSEGVDFFGGDQETAWVGKKAAGRLLDGVQHDGYPSPQ